MHIFVLAYGYILIDIAKNVLWMLKFVINVVIQLYYLSSLGGM